MEDNVLSSDEVVEEGFVALPGAGKFLSVSRSFLYLVMDRGELVYVKFGRSRRIPISALKKYAQERLIGRMSDL